MGRTSRKRRRKNQILKDFFTYDEDIFERLKSWMLHNNWKPICNLIPHVFETTGRGLMTFDKIEKNGIVLKIPKSLLITTCTVSQSFVHNLFSTDKNYSAQCVVATFLIYEKHLENYSLWKPYLDTLPRFYTNPEFCTKSEKFFLPNFIKDELFTMKNKLNSNYLSLVESIKLLKIKHCNHCQQSFLNIFSYQNFVWAYYTVNTRSIYMNNINKELPNSTINIQGEDNLAMAPLLDLFNHNCETVAKAELVFSDNKEYYQIEALRSYEPKMQVFINYGSHNNQKLYFEYGFFIPNNCLDEIYFNLSDIEKCHQISVSTFSFIKTNQFDKSMAFTVEGLNYNAKIVLFILTAKTLNSSVLKEKIYRDNLNCDDLELLHQIGLIILQNLRNEYRSALEKMMKITHKSKSFSVSIGFMKECIQVIEKSFIVHLKHFKEHL